MGEIRSAFCSEDTWYGILELAISGAEGPVAKRIVDFIAFCEDWNERQRNGSADPSEFEMFSDLIGTGLWTVKCKELSPLSIEEAPVFFVGKEITWRTP